MKALYCGKQISGLMRGKYLAKLWLTKKFGNTKTRKINPETGEDDPNGYPVESERDIAAMEWAYATQGLTADKPGYDKDFVNDRIWYELATPEEQDERARFEMADDQMYRNM
jgi:hypothetical protein